MSNPICQECLKLGRTIALHRHKTLKDGRQMWICLKPSKRHPTAKGCGRTTRDNPKAPHRPRTKGVIDKIPTPRKPRPVCPHSTQDCKLSSNGPKNWACRTDRGGCGTVIPKPKPDTDAQN